MAFYIVLFKSINIIQNKLKTKTIQLSLLSIKHYNEN